MSRLTHQWRARSLTLLPFYMLVMAGVWLLPALLFSNLQASVPNTSTVISLSQNKNIYPLGLEIDILEDQNGVLTIEDVFLHDRDLDWKRSTEKIPSFGYTSSVYWVKFSTKNRFNELQKWLLEVNYPSMDLVHFYSHNRSTLFRNLVPIKKVSGDSQPFRKREISHRNFVFNVQLFPKQQQTFYLRFQTKGSMQFPITLWEPSSFYENVKNESYVLGIFFGIMLVMTLYNSLIFISVRDKSYFFYVMYIICFTLFLTSLNGLATEHFWPEQVEWSNMSNLIFACLGLSFALLFTRSYMNTAEALEKLDRTLLVMAIISASSVFLVVWIEYHHAAKVIITLAVLTAITIFATGFIRVKQRFRPARYFLLSWSVFLCGIMAYALKQSGILPYNFVTEYGAQIGASLEVMLLSLALADRINTMKQKTITAQQKTLRAQKLDLDHQIQLTSAYDRFIPHKFLELIGKSSITEVKLGDNVEKTMSVVFTDIRSFSHLSAKLSPSDNFNYINAYLSEVGPVIRQNNGFIDKFIGDGIMALFDKSADDAISAAIAMQKALERHNTQCQLSGLDAIKIGTGINTGELMLGTVGEYGRMEGTVISEAVNLANRVESLTKTFNIPILITECTYQALRNPSRYYLRNIDYLHISSDQLPIKIYEVFEADPAYLRRQKIKTCDNFEQAVKLYHQNNFHSAAHLFKQCLEHAPNDTVTLHYLKRCKHQFAP